MENNEKDMAKMSEWFIISKTKVFFFNSKYLAVL